MAVTMSHRFDQDKTTLREELRSGRHGRLDYLVFRYSAEWRNGGLGTFIYHIPDPLLVDMSVHHFDMLADLAGAPCESVFCQTWNPSWSTFEHDANGLALLKFANGVHASYEGANTNAVSMNNWGEDYIRAECEGATLLLTNRRLEVFPFAPQERKSVRIGEGLEIPLVPGTKWKNALLIEKFVDWLEGGEPMETNVESNLQSLAIVFAAIESTRTGAAVRPADPLARLHID
jgi:predicted dehydrogenase